MDNNEYIVPFSIIKSYTQDWDNEIDLKIQALYNLKDGWDFGGGLAPSKQVIENSLMLFHYFEKPYFEYGITPTSTGGVKITCKLENNFLDITINLDLTIDLTHEIGIGEDYDTVYDQRGVDLLEIESQINELIKECHISERYTLTNIII
jgi:hypothetical protein